MNLGTIIRSNSKGQVVIPKKIRDKVGIDENVVLSVSQRGKGVYLVPLSRGISKDSRALMLKILKNTAGIWGTTTADEKKREKQQRKIELVASKNRKKQW